MIIDKKTHSNHFLFHIVNEAVATVELLHSEHCDHSVSKRELAKVQKRATKRIKG